MLPRTERIINRILGYLLIVLGITLIAVVLFGVETFLTGVFLFFVGIACILGGIQTIYYATIEAMKEKIFIDKEMEG